MINSKTLAVLVIIILFGGIMVSARPGLWRTESKKATAIFKFGEFAGQANPADIRGSYTFSDVEKISKYLQKFWKGLSTNSLILEII